MSTKIQHLMTIFSAALIPEVFFPVFVFVGISKDYSIKSSKT